MMTASKLLQYARRWRSTAKEVFGHSVMFAQFFSLLHITETYICSPTLGHGPSMLPTLNFSGNILLVEKLSHSLGRVGPGDVVLVWLPENLMKTIRKRILGVDGDTVAFLADSSRCDLSTSLVVPKGHVWIQGDNITRLMIHDNSD
ncbi:mitochondrial inner membrane protease subunit 1 [Phtheirospermum japonicum]|uniref:Mitochondrial inner membrane protease subunit 1 n=1 Tax=Phtheirospermum japonicum TaxID=374723 RepID=A0A830DKT5_9LAMI|nr:mitochondrial inner membrane protease subunit 1 [Phtheirospermum japonicum]